MAPADLWCRYGERLTGPDVVALESDAREFAALRATCTGNGNRELSWFAVREGRVLSMAWAESVPGTLDDEVAQEIMDLLSSKLIDP